MMKSGPESGLWDQRLARALVRPFAHTPLRPNHVTTLGLGASVIAAGLFAWGGPAAAHVAALLFVLAVFLDHADGELARMTGKATRLGFYYDYAAGGVMYATLFLGVGIGLAEEGHNAWAVTLGGAAAVAVWAGMLLRLAIEARFGKPAVRYPRRAGFELEDGMYLVGPATWTGMLMPFFVAASIGTFAYGLWLLVRFLRLRARPKDDINRPPPAGFGDGEEGGITDLGS